MPDRENPSRREMDAFVAGQMRDAERHERREQRLWMVIMAAIGGAAGAMSSASVSLLGKLLAYLWVHLHVGFKP